MSKALLGIAVALALLALAALLLRGERAAPVSAGGASTMSAGRESPPAPPASPAASEVPAAPAREVGAPEPAAEPAAEGEQAAEASTVAQPDQDPVGCILLGQVTDAAGAPIGGDQAQYVNFEDAAGEILRARVGKDGAYSISGLVPGRWLVSCGAMGYRPHRAPVDLGSGSRSVRYDIALERSAGVRVILRAPDGRPFFEALREDGSSVRPGMIPTAVATAEPPGATFDQGQHARLGSFVKTGFDLEGPPGCLGTLVLDGAPPVWISLTLESAVLATERVELGDEEVVFTLAAERLLAGRSALRVRLVEAESGAPIDGAEITLLGHGTTVGPDPRTDAEGVAVVEPMAPGDYDFWVRAPGREGGRRKVTLVPGETLDMGTLELAPGMSISGRLVDAQGTPVVSYVRVGIVDPVSRATAMIESQLWRSDRNGAFAIDSLPRGEFVVRSDGDQLSNLEEPEVRTQNALVSTLSGSVSGVELVLLPIGRLLLRPEREDWRSLRYRVLDEQGLERAGGRMRDRLQFAVHLPHGRYRVLVTDTGGGIVLEQAIAIGNEPVAIELPEE